MKLDVRNPAQGVLVAFVTLSLIGTLLLRLPWALNDGVEMAWFDTLFWGTSASTITGLTTVDISAFSAFGEVVILVLMQVGGFGIMTIGSVLALVMSRRLGIRRRLLAQTELGAAIEMGEMRSLLQAIARFTLCAEAVLAIVLFSVFTLRHDVAPGRAAYSAVFHAVSAWNNAGIALRSDSLAAYGSDPLVLLPVSVVFVVGGLGFPILVEFVRRVPRRRWALNTRITLLATAVLLVIGPLLVLVLEWSNEATLGPMGAPHKLLTAWFQGATPRTAGFHTFDIAAQREPTLNLQTALMFIGAGPASTSGGIKVTTFAVLGFAMWSEVRGDPDVNVFRRRLSPAAIRQAMTMALLAVGVVFGTGILLSSVSDFSFTRTLFESASAFGTTGLSTGVTAGAPAVGQWALLLMMLVGRVGPMTFVTALALRETRRAYRFAEERPIIG
ncbi:MAG TPA: potassium transporter TrkG [Ilumatobacter sp.]|nr:potassium transporter TrkG [Ilumatobacter sp.]